MHRRLPLLLLLTASLTFAGCTDDEGDDMTGMPVPGEDDVDEMVVEPTPISATVTISGVYVPAGDAYEYTAQITAPQGSELTVTFENNDQNQATSHDWYLEALDVGTEVIGSGETDSVTFIVDLEPGEYAYYCTVPGHRDGGMEGTLVVTAS